MWESRWHHQASGAEPRCATRSGPNKRMLNRTHRITAVILCCTIIVLPASEHALTIKPPGADALAGTMSDADAGSLEMLAGGPCLAPQSAAARTFQAGPIHVDACAPGNGNGSEAKPYDTLTRAVKAASSGDTIVIHAGDYGECLTIKDKRLTLTAFGGRVLVSGTPVMEKIDESPPAAMPEEIPQPGPLGGGLGYGDWVEPTPLPPECAAQHGTQYVSTAEQLLCALERTTVDDTYNVVYVDDNAEIDLTNYDGVEIPDGVMLASGRGRTGTRGGLLYSDRETKKGMLVVSGTNVRITGLRLRGPRPQIDWPGCYETPFGDARGIQVHNENSVCKDPDEWPGRPDFEVTIIERNVEIDNNELWAWPGSAVSTQCVRTVHVHHNHIHHNRHEERSSGCRDYGLGYGVVTTNGLAVIEANVFDHNRHDIASDGQRWASYQARYNLVLDGAVSHSFDVHGGADRCGGEKVCDGENDPRSKKGCSTSEEGCCCIPDDIAGRIFVIEHNTFLQNDKPAIKIRGAPVEGALVRANRFNHKSWCWTWNCPVVQSNVDEWTRVQRLGNTYGYDPGPAWFVSSAGESYWQLLRFDDTEMSRVRFTDFDALGGEDAFRQRDGQWQVALFGAYQWVPIATSEIGVKHLVFGDFDGDGLIGVFRIQGAQWLVAEPGEHCWAEINELGGSIGSYRFGDFDGNGTMDVLMTNGEHWYVSQSGTEPWSLPWKSDEHSTFDRLALADFYGDRVTDVFRVEGGDWWISRGGSEDWELLNWDMQGDLEDFRFGDFDGNGWTDVFRTQGGVWYVSWSGLSMWQELNRSDYGIDHLAFADVTGDGRTDVIVKRHPW